MDVRHSQIQRCAGTCAIEAKRKMSGRSATHRHTARIRNAMCMLLAGLAAVGGCAHRDAESWTRPPQVNWADLCNANVHWRRNHFTLLTKGPTKGMFPAEIAVTRISREEDETRQGIVRAKLVRDPRNEFLQWNRTFDDQMAISAVFPVAQRDLGGGDPTPERINAAMRALHAGIGLIYAFNQVSEHESEMFGTLYDASLGWPLATIHASAKSLTPPAKQDDDDEAEDAYEDLTMWEKDSHALARQAFERLFYACIRELIMRDQPAEVTAPDGWVPVGPIMPVQWPPFR